MTPKDGISPQELERARETLRGMEGAQRDRQPAVEEPTPPLGAVLFWIAAIAVAIVVGVTVCSCASVGLGQLG
jgi:hypothetical protein